MTVKEQNARGNGTLLYPDYCGSHVFIHRILYYQKKVNFTVW